MQLSSRGKVEATAGCVCASAQRGSNLQREVVGFIFDRVILLHVEDSSAERQ